MKKYIFIFFALIQPLMASARSEQFYNTLVNGIYYKFNTDDLTACVSYKSIFIGYYAEDPDWVEFERIYNDYSGDVMIPEKVTYDNITYTVTSIDRYAFWQRYIYPAHWGATGCIDMTSVTIPSSVKSIDYGTFRKCSGLIYVVLPQYLESLNENVFDGCDGLTDIYCYSETVPSAYENSFYNPENIILHVPEESIEAYRTTEPWDKFKDYVPLTKSDIEATEKCSKPTITLVDGKITFNCETPGVTYHWMMSSPSGTSGSSSIIQPITLKVYATKSGYQNSDVTTYKFPAVNGDVDANGVVNVADHVKLSEIIMNQ